MKRIGQEKFEPALNVARRMLEHASAPREDDGENGVRYTALYSLLALELHLGMPRDEGMDKRLAELSEDDRMVIEDPILRARTVAYVCTAMAADVERATRLGHTVFPEVMPHLREEIENLYDLRFNAALTITDENRQEALALLPHLSERIPSTGAYPLADKILI